MSVLLLHPYLEGLYFIIRTDQNALKCIQTLPMLRQTCLKRLRLSETEFDVVHHAGIKHQAFDALSRLSTTGEYNTPIASGLPVMLVVSSTKNDRKIGTSTADVFNAYDDNECNFMSPLFSAVCSVMVSKPETDG